MELHGLTWGAVRGWPIELKKLASQSLASSDSVHRNIAEGCCRRTLRGCLRYLNVALGSLGEILSGFIVCLRNGQIEQSGFEPIDTLLFRLKKSLLKLVESLEHKRNKKDWTETLVRDDSVEYVAYDAVTTGLNLLLRNALPEQPSLQDSNTPVLHP